MDSVLVNIDKYLLLGNENGDKRLRRKIHKSKLDSFFTVSKVSDEKSRIDALRHFILNERNQNYKLSNQTILGVLSDKHILAEDKNVKNLMLLNEPPKEWDILFLQGEIQSVDYKNEHNNLFWTRCSVSDTGHFVINLKCADRLIKITKKYSDWKSVISEINKLNIFVANHSFMTVPFTEQSSNVKLQEKSKICLDYNELSKKELSCEIPKISFVCPLTDTNKIFYTIMSFLKLEYPDAHSNAELIIVDTINAERKLKMFVPQDPRIKVITVPNKDNLEIPLDYQLNTGVKYARGEIIYHLLDTHCYFLSNVLSLVKVLIHSDKKILMGCDQLKYMQKTKESGLIKLPEIANIMYFKKAWETRVFQTDLIYDFLNFRWNCVGWLPGLYYSFQQQDNDCTDSFYKLPLNLPDLIYRELKNSYDLVFGSDAKQKLVTGSEEK